MNSGKYGKLYGVGVGPGATDLITLRAVHVLNSVSVLAIPQSSEHLEPFAWKVCSPIVRENSSQEKLFLHFPMTKDPKILIPAWDKAFSEIGKRLEKKHNVAFITQGDPSVYSSWNYLLEEAKDRWPGIELEIVPAVSSVTAIPAALQTPLADGRERFCVFPGTYGLEDLPELIRHFDTIVLTKVGRVIPKLVSILKDLNLLRNASYVSYGTTDRQKIVKNLETIQNESCDYFSMVIISIRKRKGALKGQNIETE
ncbi:precorrin-2 C(20)-methyltransferase [Leptospira santarosai]|uniref:Precorrin-2 C(20)-methyltransferase n=2 Tax=Leptospira santarosai TaxID=28183 RepID=M6V032_9LEPT|nr:precorrin-2 C(20)-methyltransferase [Leptospira santarosai]EMO58778.1 precorrin-2 C(20)-methyltransferase [Leptospira santarosai str. CBC1416]AVV81157.1 Precorrin-2 C(20)-methyltransferase [Leptospira santarosai]EMJ46576.1 precorrin-2 C(20)-methyltransferase [Leptospira santarosai str. HAI1349]EMO20930.1 precorrin-2 C(20)-methyltransferase [Leptospira santarosai str. HAI134]EMO31184.1 precorrin-2 C(20)-methyltransferase [Leptospira santarosai str. HAI821]